MHLWSKRYSISFLIFGSHQTILVAYSSFVQVPLPLTQSLQVDKVSQSLGRVVVDGLRREFGTGIAVHVLGLRLRHRHKSAVDSSGRKAGVHVDVKQLLVLPQRGEGVRGGSNLAYVVHGAVDSGG